MSSSAKESQHFPFKLYAMLEYAAESEHSHAVSWIQMGQGFAILDKDAFLEHIVPKFFKQTKYRSFTRQLNLWGFTRAQEGLGRAGGAWRHEHFLRGQVERLGCIQRVEVKSGKARQWSEATKSSGREPEPRGPASNPNPVGVANAVISPTEPGNSAPDAPVPRARSNSVSEVTTEFISPLLLPARFQSQSAPPTPTTPEAIFPPVQFQSHVQTHPATVQGGFKAQMPPAQASRAPPPPAQTDHEALFPSAQFQSHVQTHPATVQGGFEALMPPAQAIRAPPPPDRIDRANRRVTLDDPEPELDILFILSSIVGSDDAGFALSDEVREDFANPLRI